MSNPKVFITAQGDRFNGALTKLEGVLHSNEFPHSPAGIELRDAYAEANAKLHAANMVAIMSNGEDLGAEIETSVRESVDKVNTLVDTYVG